MSIYARVVKEPEPLPERNSYRIWLDRKLNSTMMSPDGYLVFKFPVKVVETAFSYKIESRHDHAYPLYSVGDEIELVPFSPNQETYFVGRVEELKKEIEELYKRKKQVEDAIREEQRRLKQFEEQVSNTQISVRFEKEALMNIIELSDNKDKLQSECKGLRRTVEQYERRLTSVTEASDAKEAIAKIKEQLKALERLKAEKIEEYLDEELMRQEARRLLREEDFVPEPTLDKPSIWCKLWN